MRKIGINVVTLWPQSINYSGPSSSVSIALESGFDGIQALPLRGWTKEVLGDSYILKHILSFEDSWNYGGFGKSLIGSLTGTSPNLLDWLLFGKNQSLDCWLQSYALFISHKFRGDCIVEMHPELSVVIDDYVKHISKGGGVCWDTLHATRAHRKTLVPMPDKDRLFRSVVHGIKVVHLHAYYDDADTFLKKGKSSDFWKEIDFLNKNLPQDVPFIWEVFPDLTRRKEMVSRLCDITTLIRECLN